MNVTKSITLLFLLIITTMSAFALGEVIFSDDATGTLGNKWFEGPDGGVNYCGPNCWVWFYENAILKFVNDEGFSASNIFIQNDTGKTFTTGNYTLNWTAVDGFTGGLSLGFIPTPDNFCDQDVMFGVGCGNAWGTGVEWEQPINTSAGNHTLTIILDLDANKAYFYKDFHLEYTHNLNSAWNFSRVNANANVASGTTNSGFANIVLRNGSFIPTPPANSAPVMVTTTLTKNTANTTLIFSANATDANNDPITFFWRVFQNGTSYSSGSAGTFTQGITTNFANLTISQAATYILQVTPNDGTVNGTAQNSTGVTVTYPSPPPPPGISPVQSFTNTATLALILFIGAVITLFVFFQFFPTQTVEDQMGKLRKYGAVIGIIVLVALLAAAISLL